VPKLPIISGKELLKFLQKRGFMAVKTKGSHVKVKGHGKTFTVPLHKELDRGTLSAILDQAGINKEQLRQGSRR